MLHCDARCPSKANHAAKRSLKSATTAGDRVPQFRVAGSGQIREHGVTALRASAAVPGSALDGPVMQRALDPILTSEAVAPVLSRLLMPGR
ncbi:MAG: hypothetical protein HOV94_18125 [Saccharothrix sp.]|nr:hypothetical protein [Saccharothrix sp.]